jgi:glutamine amidotransferase PdxT
MEPLRDFGQKHAIWGTCAGAIFLSRDINRNQPLLGLMDITVARNAFGRQVDSFEADLDIPVLAQVDPSNKPYHAVFIRAPLIESVSEVQRERQEGQGRRVRQEAAEPEARHHRSFLCEPDASRRTPHDGRYPDKGDHVPGDRQGE